ncbi:hypothetical protein BpHYR1_014429 [Brachionus plicatilis]|uniref:Uncharacterized protein n=1 Tax=Brachionus plicatilis TaxID=10195 RepID=A0A3M7SJT2_BRAPC|nr:hypothetical protein BpHYR1_014429 [Brachionus plicatilis]
MGEMVFIACVKVVFRVLRLQYRTREYDLAQFSLLEMCLKKIKMTNCAAFQAMKKYLYFKK